MIPGSINARGTIAGHHSPSTGGVQGFIRAANGTFTLFDPPNSRRTVVISINDEGSVAGWFLYADPSTGARRFRGFVREVTASGD